MAEKRYYWFKFQEDFFDDKRIKRLRQIPGGDTYLVIYLRLMNRTLNTKGYLYFDNVFDNFYEEIAMDIGEQPESVRMTINILLKLGLIEQSPDGNILHLTELENNIGSESASAKRVRDYRARQSQNALPCNDTALHCNAPLLQYNTDVTKTLPCNDTALHCNAPLLQCNTDVTKTLQCNADVTDMKQKCNARDRDKDININNLSNDRLLSDSKKSDEEKSDEEIPEEVNPSITNHYRDIIDKWNSLAEFGISSIRFIAPNSNREKLLKARLKQYGKESFDVIIEEIKKSDWIQGKVPDARGKYFDLDFEWIIKPSNYPKVLEGKYRNKDPKPQDDLNITPFPKITRNRFNEMMHEPPRSSEDWAALETQIIDN